MTTDSITLPGEGDTVVADTPASGPHSGDKVQGVSLWAYDPDGNPVPLQATADGLLATGTNTITKTAVELAPGVWFYDLSDAESGDVFDLTAVPHQAGSVAVVVCVPDPADPQAFTANWHVDATDPTSFLAFTDPAFANAPDGYPLTALAESFTSHGIVNDNWTGAADAQLAVRSAGDGTYVALAVDRSLDPFRSFYKGLGLDGEQASLVGAMGHHEGMFDRFLEACGLSEDPAFDIGSPVWDYGGLVAKGIVVALALANGDPEDPWAWRVGEDGTTLTPLPDPAVFNPPGNGYLVIFNSPGDPDDGRWYRYKSNDQGQINRAGSPMVLDDPTGLWEIRDAPTGFVAAG